MLAGNDAFIPTSFESIATVSGTGSSTSVTFASIPSDFQHLQIRVLAKDASIFGSSGVGLRFNGDSGANYTRHAVYGTGSSAAAYGQTGLDWASVDGACLGTDTAYANMFAVGIIDIHDYKSTTKNKTVRAITGFDTNGNPWGQSVYLMSNLWNNTAAITSISIHSTSGSNFTTTSRFALYGIKGA